MAGHVPQFVGTEDLVDEIGVFQGDIQEAAFARGLVMGDRGLVQVAHIVEFVVDAQIGPARSALPFRIQLLDRAVAFSNRPRRVEIAVLLLGSADEFDQVVEIGVQLRIRMQVERIAGALDDLEDVRVVEEDAVVFALCKAGRLGEVGDALRLLAFLEVVGDRSPCGWSRCAATRRHRRR